MDLVSLRRQFHEYPELGFTEFRTANVIMEHLTSMNIPFKYGTDVMNPNKRRGVPNKKIVDSAYENARLKGVSESILQQMVGGNCAVVAIIEGNEKGPTIAFRFDMDALPVNESDSLEHFPVIKGFRSKEPGLMHACGHDGHITIGLGLAEKLAKMKFKGTVKLIFQPAEEGVRGAYSMVDRGVVDDVDCMICLHLGMGEPSKNFYASTNNFLATTKMTAEFLGVPSHAGAQPELGKNALVAAATALLNIHSIPNFSTGLSRVNVGVLNGGKAANIIPSYASMIIETRADNEEINKEIVRRVLNIIQKSAEMLEVECNTEIIGHAIPIKCDDEVVNQMVKVAEESVFFDYVGRSLVNPSIGSEDASFFIKRVQQNGGLGTYMIVGSNSNFPHHHEKFDIDEAVLAPTVQLLTDFVLTYKGEE